VRKWCLFCEYTRGYKSKREANIKGGRDWLERREETWHNTAYGKMMEVEGLRWVSPSSKRLGSLGAVPGGFDSHTPLPVSYDVFLRIPP